MPELCCVNSRDFKLVIWSKDLAKKSDRYLNTVYQRGGTSRPSTISFFPCLPAENEQTVSEVMLAGNSPVFFENTSYDIEVIFEPKLLAKFATDVPFIRHPALSIEESFHYSEYTGSLRGSVNTANHVGTLALELFYPAESGEVIHTISFVVNPTKMDMHDDFNRIVVDIEKVYPLWLYTLPKATYQGLSAKREAKQPYLLFWLSRFDSFQQEFNSGLKTLLAAPHGKLVSSDRRVRIDRIKGKLKSKQEQIVTTNLTNGISHRRVDVNTKRISVDNPENRFIKHIVNVALQRLIRISFLVSSNESVSKSYALNIDEWKQEMKVFHNHPLFKEIGEYAEFGKGSLVLQKKAGYSKVYSSWQKMKWFLDLIEGQQNTSTRPLSELYEVWAFLEVRRIILDIGFKETTGTKGKLVSNDLDTKMLDGKRGAFHFVSDEGTRLFLSHEPEFNTASLEVKSLTTTQRPDIYLKAVFADQQEAAWIFDAKYRIDEADKSPVDLVPVDAINQLHRYRDSLYSGYKSTDSMSTRYRPVFGAYALYPGKFNQLVQSNPYQSSIDNAGIGAFSLLPSSDRSDSRWLHSFLKSKLTNIGRHSGLELSDHTSLDEIVRTGFEGTKVSKYNDLTIVANQIGPNRSEQYISNFKSGKANYYHMRCAASDRQNIASIVIREARFIAVALDDSSNERIVQFVYPIVSVACVSRNSISNTQSGVNTTAFGEDKYWLFSLGHALSLKSSITLDAEVKFKLFLCGLDDLSSYKHIDSIKTRYDGVQL